MDIRAVLSRFLLYLISSDLPIYKVNPKGAKRRNGDCRVDDRVAVAYFK